MTKRDKSAVHYRPSNDPEYRCANCDHSYRSNARHLCEKVQGLIWSEDVCDLWKAEKGK